MASQASARQFCRPAVAAGRSRDWSDSFVRRLRPIEAVGISGERTGEFSSFAEAHQAGGNEGCRRYNELYFFFNSQTSGR